MYESDAHGQLLNMGGKLGLRYLGCHKPNSKASLLEPKRAVCLGFNNLTTVIVLGRSLQNCDGIGTGTVPSDKYILPFCTNFPSHDSFVIMKASLFYDVKKGVKGGKNQITKGHLQHYHVLVGFQMTVSGKRHMTTCPSTSQTLLSPK